MNTKKIILSLAMLFIASSCNLLLGGHEQYPTTLSSSKNLKFYSIDSEIFLRSLEQGHLDIMTPVVATPDIYPTPSQNKRSYMWTYQEYQNITERLEKSFWADGLSEWKLDSMYFNVDCQSPLHGFTIGDFRYFKEVDEGGKSLYSVREVLIRSADSDITIGSGSTYPKTTFGWNNIDLNKVVVDADRALQISEKNGGQGFRLSVINKCQVFLSFNPNSGYDGWKVLYDAGGTNSFQIYVGAYDDDYRIIR